MCCPVAHLFQIWQYVLSVLKCENTVFCISSCQIIESCDLQRQPFSSSVVNSIMESSVLEGLHVVVLE